MQLFWDAVSPFHVLGEKGELDSWHYGERGMQNRLTYFWDIFMKQMMTTMYLTIDDGCAEHARHVGTALPTEAAAPDAMVVGRVIPVYHDMAYVGGGDEDLGIREPVYSGADHSADADATLAHVSTEELVRDAYPIDPGQARQVRGRASAAVASYLDHCSPRFEKIEGPSIWTDVH